MKTKLNPSKVKTTVATRNSGREKWKQISSENYRAPIGQPWRRKPFNYKPAQTCIKSQDHFISLNLSTWNFPRAASRPRPTDPRPNTLTPAISQNGFAPLSIELENTWKNNNSDNQSNYDRGTNNYIKKESNHILQRSNANDINANKRPDICLTEK